MAGEDWPILPLGQLTENLDGRRIPVKELDRKPGPYPYYGASGIVDRVDGYLFDGEYLLIGEDGENLRTRQTPIAFIATGKFWVNNHAHIVRGNHRADTRFLSYVLSQTDISGYLTGSTMPKLTQGNLNRVPVIAPPLAEQKAIAVVLGALDDKIELNRRMNATLEAMARALFQSWFVDFDPVRAKLDGRQPVGLDKVTAALFPASFDHVRTPAIPDGWQMKSVYDCAKFINGVAFRNVQFSSDNSGLPVVKIAELKGGISSQTKFTTEELDSRYRICDGEILFSWSGSPDTSIDTFVWAGRNGWLNQHIFRVDFYQPEEKLFVYYLLKHLKPTFIEIARDKQTTGLGHVTAQDLKRLQVAFPTVSVLQAFQRVAEPVFARCFATLTESRTLAALRDTLLPKLLSGELSVNGIAELHRA